VKSKSTAPVLSATAIRLAMQLMLRKQPGAPKPASEIGSGLPLDDVRLSPNCTIAIALALPPLARTRKACP
jgi:hypothetical protein